MKLPPDWSVANSKSATLPDGQTGYTVVLQDANKAFGPKGTTFSDYPTVTIQTIDVSRYKINPTANMKNFYAFCNQQNDIKIGELNTEAKDLNADRFVASAGIAWGIPQIAGQTGYDSVYPEPPYGHTYSLDVYAPQPPNTIIKFSGESPYDGIHPILENVMGEITATFDPH